MPVSIRNRCWFFVGAIFAALAARAYSAEPPSADSRRSANEEFLRVARDAEGTPVALEVAVVRYRPANGANEGPTVDLVGAVHVAEKQYYAHLNRLFRKYDVVLYELVAPEGSRVPRGGPPAGSNPVSGLQRLMKDLLELEFQLDQIDYTRPNMVHADMSPEQFAESMRKRGESFMAMFLRMFGYSLAKQQSPSTSSDVDFLAALFSPNRALALKRVMAEQFADMGGLTVAMEGPEGSTLIGERNRVALEGLRQQLAAGKKRLAIFYGAGHMIDMDRRLQSDFQLKPVSRRWLVAWDMKGAAAPRKQSADAKPAQEPAPAQPAPEPPRAQPVQESAPAQPAQQPAP